MIIKKKICFAILSLISFSIYSVYANNKLQLDGKEFKRFSAYKEENAIYVTPEILESGGKWRIKEENGKMFALVKVDEKVEKVEIPFITRDNKKLVDFDFFSTQAGIEGILNAKKTKLKIKKIKEINSLPIKLKSKPLIIWDPDNEFDPDLAFFDENSGTRIISPTLGSINVFGKAFSNEFVSYLKKIKNAGIEIMPLVHNNFDLEKTRDFVSDIKKVEEVTSRMSAYSEVYKFDGYNIDFENMYKEDKDLFTEFIKKLSNKIHNKNKKVTVDITVIEPTSDYWSMCYDRKSLAKYADYQIIMGYDETPAASKYAGSVASYNWLDSKMHNLLQEVPSEKLILGIPFYTRAWVGNDGNAVSYVLTIKNNNEFLKKHNVRLVWQDKEKQYKGFYTVNGIQARIWLEEKRSLSEKIKLAKKYNLGGLAFWRYGFETPDIYRYLENKWIDDSDKYDIWNNFEGSILEKIRKQKRLKHSID